MVQWVKNPNAVAQVAAEVWVGFSPCCQWVKGSGVVTAAMAWIQPLVGELPCATRVVIKLKKKKLKNIIQDESSTCIKEIVNEKRKLCSKHLHLCVVLKRY